MMKDVHPLKRKSVKPSSSTVRGMLPARQFRALDAAMQSLRAAGLRFEWQWRDKDLGWVCSGIYEDITFCELLPAQSPLVGQVRLSLKMCKKAMETTGIPARFQGILKSPLEKENGHCVWEFELESTPQRDLLSDFVEALQTLVEVKN